MNAWNPREIWTMVVLVSGISLVGYLLAKFLGDKGTLLAGALGGLVSSTATTLSLARRSREKDTAIAVEALGIVAANTIMFPRVLILILFVNAALAGTLWPWIALITVAGSAIAFWMYKRERPRGPKAMPLRDPLISLQRSSSPRCTP
jgi:uncharacterized membrane protein (DUF4010 family)